MILYFAFSFLLNKLDAVLLGHGTDPRQRFHTEPALAKLSSAFLEGLLNNDARTHGSCPRITDELENERIDIVPYDEDIKKYAANALQPAKVKDVLVNEEKHELLVKVSDEQSRVAFGRKAQNIRLSAKLIGWNITLRNEDAAKDAVPEVSIEEKMEQAAGKLASDFNVSVETARILVSNGFVTIDGVKAAEADTLLSLDGIDSAEIEAALAELNK